MIRKFVGIKNNIFDHVKYVLRTKSGTSLDRDELQQNQCVKPSLIPARQQDRLLLKIYLSCLKVSLSFHTQDALIYGILGYA